MTAYPEPLVARVIGVKKPRLASVRRAQLERDADWILENQVVCYRPAGLEKLLRALGLDREAFAWPTDAGDSQDTPEAPEARIEAIADAGEAVEAEDEEKNGADPVAAVASGVEAAANGQRLLELTVRGVSRNPVVLYAHAPGIPGEVLVRVKSNANFLPGMKLFAREPGPAGGPWFHEGNCPRWRGHY